MNSIRFVVASLATGLFAIALSATGCGGTKDGFSGVTNPPNGGGHDASTSGGDDAGLSLGTVNDATVGCTGLQCSVASCGNGITTTVSGTVYDPAGATPLYNVIVYVPNAPLDPFKSGPTCDQCGVVASGSPITSALTDEKGNFVLQNVPTGTDVPLVMQVGKWRRQVKIPSVKSCTDNRITDANLTRLPKNHIEGDMPQMALTTGGCDALECLFYKMGIDPVEFTNGTGAGKMHIYTGTSGEVIDNSTDATPFWSDKSNLMKYDIVLLSCECGPNPSTKPQAALQAMHDYANAGGRVFGTHYHYYWFQSGPADFQGTATWTPDQDTGTTASSYSIDTSFPKGKSFAQWLVNVKASTTLGSIDLSPMGDVADINTAETQQWIYNPSPQSAKYLTFNTPVGQPPAQQCGRAVYSDIHVTGSGGTSFPSDCGTVGDLTPQEKALEFLFFDLSSCIQDPHQPPPPPPVK